MHRNWNESAWTCHYRGSYSTDGQPVGGSLPASSPPPGIYQGPCRTAGDYQGSYRTDGQPVGGSPSAHRDMNYWAEQDAQSRTSEAPSQFRLPGRQASLWISGEAHITYEFLNTFDIKPLVITCKNGRVASVDAACRSLNMSLPFLYNFGHWKIRFRDWPQVMVMVKQAIDQGQDVILHCAAGRHRAATTGTLVLMWGCGITFEEARQIVEAKRRSVEIGKVVDERRGEMLRWIQQWQDSATSMDGTDRAAMQDQMAYRFNEPQCVPRPRWWPQPAQSSVPAAQPQPAPSAEDLRGTTWNPTAIYLSPSDFPLLGVHYPATPKPTRPVPREKKKPGGGAPPAEKSTASASAGPPQAPETQGLGEAVGQVPHGRKSATPYGDTSSSEDEAFGWRWVKDEWRHV